MLAGVTGGARLPEFATKVTFDRIGRQGNEWDWLVALFVMRPAALGAVRLLLAGGGERTRGAAEMVDSLDSRFWLRC